MTLSDGIKDMIEGGRLTQGMIPPDDWEWLMGALIPDTNIACVYRCPEEGYMDLLCATKPYNPPECHFCGGPTTLLTELEK